MNGVKFGGTAARQGGCNTELSPDSSLAPVSRGQCVAVGAQQPQVFEPVVLVVPVDVVEFERNRYGLPLGKTATSTAVLEQMFLQKASLEFVRLDWRGVIEVGRKRLPGRNPPPTTPGSAHELRRVDVVSAQRPAENAVVAAIGSDIESDQDLPDGSGSVDCGDKTFARELRLLHERIGESVET